MVITKLPDITEANYEAVRDLLKNGVPSTYREWLDLRAQWLKHYAGDNIISVEVDPKELARFLDTHRHAHDLMTLLDFVHSKDAQ